MVTLTKLFVIKIVAKVLSESFRSMQIFLSAVVFFSSSSSISSGDRLKKEISDPLAYPEHKSNIAAIIAATTTPNVGLYTVKSPNCNKISISKSNINN